MSAKALKTKKARILKRAKRTRKKLKKAALDVFSEKSIDAATVEEITERADVGKGTLYQHFDDKEQIVVTLVDEAVDHLIERICNYDKHPENLEDMLEHLLNAHYGFFVDSSEEFILLFRGRTMLRLQSETLDEMEEPYLRYLREIENRVSGYVSPGIEPLKIRRLACAVAGFVFGFFSFAMIGMTENEIEKSFKPFKSSFVKTLSTFLGQ